MVHDLIKKQLLHRLNKVQSLNVVYLMATGGLEFLLATYCDVN